MTKPIIGITSNFMADIPEAVKAGIAAPNQPWVLLADEYVQALERAGAVPVILPAHVRFEENENLFSRLDGVVLSGGNDVSPMLYGERFGEHCGMLDPKRDDYEIRLASYALERDMPLLGICRGLQVLNVAEGGALYQDLPSGGFKSHSLWSGDRNTGTHQVKILEESPLWEILGKDEVWVNSFHHQAVRQLAPTLKAAAVSSGDSLIEGAWKPGKRFALAIQWHPEMMFESALQAKIFAAFAAACAQ